MTTKEAAWQDILSGPLCPYCPHKKLAEPNFRFCSKECAVRYSDSCLKCKSYPKGRIISRRFCSDECSDEWRRHKAVPLSLRPICDQGTACTHGKTCYNRHCVSRDSMPYHLVLIVSRSHTKRIEEYLHNECVIGDGKQWKLRVMSTDLLPVTTTAKKMDSTTRKSTESNQVSYKKRSTASRMFIAIDWIESSSKSSHTTTTSSTSSSSSSSSSTSPTATKKQKLCSTTANQSNPIPTQQVIEILLSDINLFRVLLRLYVVNGVASSTTELISKMAAALRTNAQTHSDTFATKPLCFRVRGFPKTLEKLLETTLVQSKTDAEKDETSISKTGICLSTRDLHHVVLCAMNVDDGILYGSYVYTAPIASASQAQQNEKAGNSVNATKAVDSKTSSSTNIHKRVSRAAWKLVEIFRRRPLFHPSTLKLTRKFVAIDIGASPGGWSYELASMPNCERVYAVDPGALTPPIPNNVVHLAQKIEDCTNELKAQNDNGIDVVVCDMNSSPRMTCESLLGLKDIVNVGAIIVLTFKNFVGGRKAFAKAVAEALVLLDGIVVDRELVRLMSGGVEERTVVGRFNK